MPPIDPFHLTPEDYEGPAGRTCDGCGYDLQGIPVSRPCPECGVVASAATPDNSTFRGDLAAMPDGMACVVCGTPTPGLALGAMCMACAQTQTSSVSAAAGCEPGRPVDPTHPCPECGYDLQGTSIGRPCPECGTISAQSRRGIPTSKARPTILAEGETSLRVTEKFSRSMGYRAGLALVLGSLVITAIAGIVSMNGASIDSYLKSLIVAGIAAAVASWLVTPATLDVEYPVFVVVRWGARVCLMFWPIGVLVELYRGTVSWGSAGLQCVGLFGASLLLITLASLANELEMKHVSRRLTTSVWVLFPIGVYTWLAPFPEAAIAIADGAFGLVAVIFVLISIAPWYWLLLRTLRSVWGLLSLSGWAGQAHNNEVKRDRARRARIKGD
ncbi:MAG: hypothetical protein HOO04_09210 [Phycisphaerae bacterium]|nr:hypothetical protein [Phycisphaerae bacterium]